jgi:hypothetical protein
MALLQKGYLGATPLFRNEDWFEDGSPVFVNKPNTVTLTADTTAHTKGVWAQIIASTSANASFVIFNVGTISTTATNTATLLDIAIGASGSETIIAENIAVGGAPTASANLPSALFGFPIKLPSGTRLAARIQSVVTGGKTGIIQTTIIDAGDYSTAPSSVDVIGSDTANSKGISFSGASGSWTQAIASTSQAYRAVALVLSMHSNDIANVNPATFEIGVGASGSEVTFGSARGLYQASETAQLTDPFTYLFGRNIPTGSRLAVKHNIAANPDRYGFTLIGIP